MECSVQMSAQGEEIAMMSDVKRFSKPMAATSPVEEERVHSGAVAPGTACRSVGWIS
jgi:hypothetical protein